MDVDEAEGDAAQENCGCAEVVTSLAAPTWDFVINLELDLRQKLFKTLEELYYYQLLSLSLRVGLVI